MPAGLQDTLGDVYTSLSTAFGTNLVLVMVALGCSALGFVSAWALQRVTLRLDRWSDVAGPQLAGNAASNLVPAGSVIGLAVQLRMLRGKGVDLTRAVTGLTISGLLTTVAGLCVFPVLVVLPVGDAQGIDLASATRAGVIALAVTVPVAVAVLRSDRVMRWVGRACHRAVSIVPRCHPPSDLAVRVVDERDRVREALGRHKGVATFGAFGHSVGEYFALYASLLAAGTRPSPVVVLAAYVAGNAAGMIPFTPGGIGFVEAGVAAVLVLSGAGEAEALAGVTVYRLVTTWIPVVAGVVAYLWSSTRRIKVSPPPVPVLEPAPVLS